MGRKVWTSADLTSSGAFAFFFNRSSRQLLVNSPAGNPATVAQATGRSIECALQWSVCQTRLGPSLCAPPAVYP